MARASRFLLLFMPIAVLLAGATCARDEKKRSFEDGAATSEEFSYSILPIGANKVRFVFSNAPSFVRSLEMSPVSREPELNCGMWLVLACSVYSQTDLICIRNAVSAASFYAGGFQLGVRPFNKYEEMLTWFPAYNDAAQTGSPLWLVLREGTTVSWRVGFMTTDEIKAFMKKGIPERGDRKGSPGVKKVRQR